MTNVKIYRNDDQQIVKYVVEGHSEFAKRGKDIVCAAVSAVAQTAALGLVRIAGIQVGYEIGEAYFECVLPEDIGEEARKKADVILETMVLGIKEFDEQYGQYIRISEVEVL